MALLMQQAHFTESDPWRPLIVISNFALFQAMINDPNTPARIGRDMKGLQTLGCLACYKPDVFGEVVEAAKTHDLDKMKAIGDKYERSK